MVCIRMGWISLKRGPEFFDMPRGEGKLYIAHIVKKENGDVDLMLVVGKETTMILSDPAPDLFPSDALITKLRLLKG